MADNEWQNMNSAPRDGTIIELECRWGSEPWYGLHRWTAERQSVDMQTGRRELSEGAPAAWVNAQDAAKAVEDERHLRWRRYDGAVGDYQRYPGFQRPGMLCPGEMVIQTVSIPMPPMPAPIQIVGPPPRRMAVVLGVVIFCAFEAGAAYARGQWVTLGVALAIIAMTPAVGFVLLPRYLPPLRSRLRRLSTLFKRTSKRP